MRIIVTIVILVSLSISPASARILDVPEAYETIMAAIGESRDRDTILLAPGTYVENLEFAGSGVVIGSRLLLTGQTEYIDSTILDGNGAAEILYMDQSSSLEMRGLTVRNTMNNGLGSAFLIGQLNQLLLQDMMIRDNRCEGFAGVIVGSVQGEITMRRCVMTNNVSGEDGSLFHAYNARFVLEDCRIYNNEAQLCGFFMGNCGLIMRRVEMTNNILPADGLYIYEQGVWSGPSQFLLDHVTLAAGDAGALFVSSDQPNVEVNVTNCIITSTNREMSLIGLSGMQELTAFFDYNDIQGDDSMLFINGEPDLEWGENNIDEDPLFVDPEVGDFHLTADSPCRDTGDPEAEVDADGSRTDMGAYAYENFTMTRLGFQVSDWNDNPLEGAVITGDFEFGRDFRFVTNEDGQVVNEVFYVPGSLLELDFEAEGYRSFHTRDSLTGDADDESWVSVRLRMAALGLPEDTLTVAVDSGSVAQANFTIRNEGDDVLVWQASARSGERAGLPLGAIREFIMVGAATADDRISGVAFDGERYYCSGGNGDDENMIYVFNREGVEVGSFFQAGQSSSGFRDLEWDGEYLWGSGVGNDTIFAMTAEGDVARSWPGPFSPNMNIACDPVHGHLWIGNIISDIVAYDRDGNALGLTVPRPASRLFGLGWNNVLDDTLGLILLCKNARNETVIVRASPTTGFMDDPVTVEESSPDPSGLYISSNYDKYQGSVLMSIDGHPEGDGGDRIAVRQFEANNRWLQIDPAGGELEGGEEASLTVTFTPTDENGDWAFRPGVYEASVEFVHDGRDGRMIVPVMVEVAEVNRVPESPAEMPKVLTLYAPYPNPFNSSTTIRFSVPGGQAFLPVKLAVYDLQGREVARLIDSHTFPPSHSHTLTWNAERLPGGIYLIRLESGSNARTEKVVLLR